MDSTVKYKINMNKHQEYVEQCKKYNPFYGKNPDFLLSTYDADKKVVPIEYFNVIDSCTINGTTLITKIKNNLGKTHIVSILVGELNTYFTHVSDISASITMPYKVATAPVYTIDIPTEMPNESLANFLLNSRYCEDLRKEAKYRYENLQQHKLELEKELAELSKEL